MTKAKILDALKRRPELKKQVREKGREIASLQREVDRASDLLAVTEGVTLHGEFPVRVNADETDFDVESPLGSNLRSAVGDLDGNLWKVFGETHSDFDIPLGEYVTRKAAVAAASDFVATGKKPAKIQGQGV